MSLRKSMITSSRRSTAAACAFIKTRLAEKKNGSECIGRSRGGSTTKIHARVDGLGNPTRIEITEGQVHDMKAAPSLIEGLESTTVLADKGYDSDALIDQVERQGCAAVIPPRRNRKQKRTYDKDVYAHRRSVEHFFQKIKRNRRVATRYEKLSVTFLGMVLIASILVWLA